MRVRVTKRVESDAFLFFTQPSLLAHAGEEHPAGMNPHGAVWLELPEGHLGVKPDEYELVECTPEELARAPEVVRLRYRVRELERHGDPMRKHIPEVCPACIASEPYREEEP